MENQVNDFIVKSKGHCFICLTKITHEQFTSVNSKSETGSKACSSLYTIQYLSRYLKMDMTKVFNQKGFISPSLLAQVKRSRLKVELCEECAGLTNSFSLLCRQFEKLKIEMKCKLDHIQSKLKTSEDVGGIKQLARFGKSEEDEGLLEVLEVLRKEATEKCSTRIGTSMPRVKIQNLSKRKVNAYLRTKRSNIKKAAEPMTAAGIGLNSVSEVKMEIPTQDFPSDEDDGNVSFDEVCGNSYQDTSKGQLKAGPGSLNIEKGMHHLSTIKNLEGEPGKGSQMIVVPFQSMSEPTANERKYTVNLQTGKYRCNLCSKEFVQSGFKYHFESVHLKIRYKCNLCSKEFSQKPNYNTHLRSAHLS